MTPTVRGQQALESVKSVFQEAPGTERSLDEVSLLTAVDRDLCRMILARLVDVRFLRWAPNGAFVHCRRHSHAGRSDGSSGRRQDDPSQREPA